MIDVVLASSSPRRRDLLTQLGLNLIVVAADIDESVRGDEDPVAYVHRLALEKCDAVAAALDPSDQQRLIVAADTTVDLDGAVLAKPDDAADACRMLRDLSGRDHLVHTGVCVRLGARWACEVATTTVTFVELSDADVEWYVATGEPFGKAGAYALQGAGGALVHGVHGSSSNVVGLPLALVVTLARRLDVELLTSEGRDDRT